MAPRRTLVTGANGQLGRAIRALAEERGVAGSFDFGDCYEFDFTNTDDYSKIDWTLYGTVINCGAYTAVGAAEAPEGRRAAWAANAQGPALLAKACAEHGITLVHISSDYVFDDIEEERFEGEPFSPLGVYGQTKAAGDIAVANCPRHYIVRPYGLANKEGVRIFAKSGNDEASLTAGGCGKEASLQDRFDTPDMARCVALKIFCLLGYRDDDVWPSSPKAFGTYGLSF